MPRKPSTKEISKVLGERKVEVSTAPPPVRAYLFMSYDLVNSTIFKQQHSEKWPSETSQFYRSAEEWLLARVTNTSVWKYAGDEVLFYTAAQSVDDVTKWVRCGYEVLTALDQQIKERSKGQLRVKGTCWAALASAEQPGGLSAPNLVFTHSSEAGAPARDFLGPEIDAGFRLGSSTCQATLALSAELAAFLLTFAPNPVTENIRLVSFQKLKGVWGNKHYPICWYRENLSDGFDYDDPYENPLLGEALQQPPKDKKDVVRIVAQFKPTYVADLRKALSASAEIVTAPPKFEVHCAAVVQRKDGKILVAKRSDTKRTYPGKWEFGCARLQPGDSFEDAVIRDYEEDFGLNVTFEDPTPVLKTYSFERDGRVVPGIVVRATLATSDDGTKRKHAAIKWIDPSNPPVEVTSNGVPDLAQLIARLKPSKPAASRPPRA